MFYSNRLATFCVYLIRQSLTLELKLKGMKNVFFIWLFFICSFSSFAQFNHQLSVQTGIYNNQVSIFTSLEGAASYEHQNSFSLGIGYQYNFNNRLSLKSSINWQSSQLTSNNISSTGSQIQQDIALATLNIPILVSYNFNRFFFIDAGPVIHFETENEPENYIDSQNGIGFSLGAGIQYSFSGFSLFAKPNLQILSVLAVAAENHHDKLFSAGFVFGLGYNF